MSPMPSMMPMSQINIENLHLLAREAPEGMRIMEFCGGHTHALVRAGLISKLPNSIQLIHGPGCPVCVLPPHHLQALIDLLESHPHVTGAVYGDVMRIPTFRGDSLLQAKNRGLSIKMIYSPLEILALAKSQPKNEFVFLAIGFETTAPATAILVQRLRAEQIRNVSILCLHVLTPPAIETVMNELPNHLRPQALIGPGHVSLVTGLEVYTDLARRFDVPIVVSGFSPQDLLESIILCLDTSHRGKVVNQYTRALKTGAQQLHRNLLADVFELRKTFLWRGLGHVPHSAYQLKEEWSQWNAENKFALQYREIPEHPSCQCSSILRGQKLPKDCKLFAKACTPSRPLGACMVSSEGACSAFYQSREQLS
jgi:hydrogenase expression/formation protein HypD